MMNDCVHLVLDFGSFAASYKIDLGIIVLLIQESYLPTWPKLPSSIELYYLYIWKIIVIACRYQTKLRPSLLNHQLTDDDSWTPPNQLTYEMYD